MSEPTCVWFTPEEKGGIRDYADALWPAILNAGLNIGMTSGVRMIRLTCPPIQSRSDIPKIVRDLRALDPAWIHIQHEFGLFGAKIPPFYQFPALVKALRREIPKAKLIATAHTVLGDHYEFPWRERGWQTSARWLINRFAGGLGIKWMRHVWTRQTWGGLDGVIVHSPLQSRIVEESGCKRVSVIPHFVPVQSAAVAQVNSKIPRILVFGYFSPEKGQDIVIRAVAKLKTPFSLILAGGVRREEDRPYLEHCRKLASDLGVADRIQFTGFVPAEEIDPFYAKATLAIAPFRETSGSGSLAQAFARGVPTLASNLLLNRELNDRVPGCLALFKSEDPQDCARVIEQLLGDADARAKLATGSRRYAEFCAPERIAQEHIEFYRSI